MRRAICPSGSSSTGSWAWSGSSCTTTAAPTTTGGAGALRRRRSRRGARLAGALHRHRWKVGSTEACVRPLRGRAPRRLPLDRLSGPRRVPLLTHRRAAAAAAAGVRGVLRFVCVACRVRFIGASHRTGGPGDRELRPPPARPARRPGSGEEHRGPESRDRVARPAHLPVPRGRRGRREQARSRPARRARVEAGHLVALQDPSLREQVRGGARAQEPALAQTSGRVRAGCARHRSAAGRARRDPRPPMDLRYGARWSAGASQARP